MTLLVPLGLLGLLGIVALIIIYIIRPNYQQKFISTTYVWKLSLRYRKKRIPISKLRNFLLILCQILILTACALILAQPHKILKEQVDGAEIIAIIDSSASMRAGDNGETRFERAVLQASDPALDVLSNDGIVSVIIADDKPEYYQQRLTSDSRALLEASFDYLLDEKKDPCSYGSSDLDSAIILCEEVIKENPNTQIYLYTDAQYAFVPESVNLVDVTKSDEWNAAILDAYAEYDENYYAFIVEVASYGKAEEIEVSLDVQSANIGASDEEVDNLPFAVSVQCEAGESKRVIFVSDSIYSADPDRFDAAYDIIETISDDERIFSYKTAHISLSEDDSYDSYARDNVFEIYGGQKETIRVQYASSLPSSFMTGMLYTLKDIYSDRWDIQITDVKVGTEPEMEGFDLYIFEHEMPETTPKDGVVFFMDPDKTPSGAGFRLTQGVDFNGTEISLTEETEHEVLKNVTADNVTISRHMRGVYDGSFEILWTCEGYPALAVKNDVDSKVVVMPFSLHYSNLPLLKEFPILIYNLFGYFFPTTVNNNSFDVYETVTLNARGIELTVSNDETNEEYVFEEFPATLALDLPGTYTMTQTTFTGEEVIEQIYVRVPAIESNIWLESDALEVPYEIEDTSDFLEDLLIYIAAALVFLLFAEWWLKGRETA